MSLTGGWSEWKEVDSKAQEVFDKMEPKQEGKLLTYRFQPQSGCTHYSFLALTKQSSLEHHLVCIIDNGKVRLGDKHTLLIPILAKSGDECAK